MSELELSNNPNVDTGFVTDGNQKNKVQLVAQLDASGIELPSSPNSDSAYVTINGKKHKVKLTAVLYGGGTSEIIHDDTLSGSGTAGSPLKVADNTYLPLSGGTLTGAINFDIPGLSDIMLRHSNNAILQSLNGTLCFGMQGYSWYSMATILPYRTNDTLGNTSSKWRALYATKLNNGSDIAVPNKAGTMALVEDINAAVGDIASALDTISGESV